MNKQQYKQFLNVKIKEMIEILINKNLYKKEMNEYNKTLYGLQNHWQFLKELLDNT